MFDLDVRGRIFCGNLRMTSVMTLPHEDRRQLVTPGIFHGRKDARLIVHHHVMLCRESLLDVIKCQFLVDVNQDPSIDGRKDTSPTSDNAMFDYATSADVEPLEGLLELHAATGQDEYLQLASELGQRIMHKHYRHKLFVPTPDSRFVRIAPRESLALVKLIAAHQGKSEQMPDDPASANYYCAPYQGHPLSEANRFNRIEDNLAVYNTKRDTTKK